MLAERAGIPIIEEQWGGPGEDRSTGQLRRRLLALHAEAADWFHRNLMKTSPGQAARDYLKSRGLTPEWPRAGRSATRRTATKTACAGRANAGIRRRKSLQGGLAKWSDDSGDAESAGRACDRFRHRLMFAISNDLGEVIAFSGRILEADRKAPKYVNSPESPLFTKGKVLFGLHMARSGR